MGNYLHHDIIGHRIVNPNRPNEQVKTTLEEKEQRRLTARRHKQKVREVNEVEANESHKKQLEERDEQVR